MCVEKRGVRNPFKVWLSNSPRVFVARYPFLVSQGTRSFFRSRTKKTGSKRKSISPNESLFRVTKSVICNQNAFQRLIRSFDWFSTNSRNELSDKIFYFSTYDISGNFWSRVESRGNRNICFIGVIKFFLMEPRSKVSRNYRWKISKYVISKCVYDKCYLKYVMRNRLKFSSYRSITMFKTLNLRYLWLLIFWNVIICIESAHSLAS